jgi:hypothetical protein
MLTRHMANLEILQMNSEISTAYVSIVQVLGQLEPSRTIYLCGHRAEMRILPRQWAHLRAMDKH